MMVDFPTGMTGVRAVRRAVVDFKQEIDYAANILLLEEAEIVLVL